MPLTSVRPYPQGPRVKNHATRRIEELLSRLVSPYAKPKMRYNSGLREWELTTYKQVDNLNLLLHHGNLSHLKLSNRVICKLSDLFVSYACKDPKNAEPDLEQWPQPFAALPLPLRQTLRFYTSDFGRIANQFCRGDYLTLNEDYPPLMIFVAVCLLNVALWRLSSGQHSTMIVNRQLWRYEFDEDNLRVMQLAQRQCRAHTLQTSHALSTSLIQHQRSKVHFSVVAANYPNLSGVSYFDDEDEVLIPAGVQLEFEFKNNMIEGAIVNTPALDHDFLYSADALRSSFQHFLVKKFRDGNETIYLYNVEINRPNHGLAHNTCVYLFLNWAISLYAQHGKDAEFKELSANMPHLMLEKLRILALFLITGRESEVGFHEDRVAYMKFKKASVENFLAYAKKSPLFQETCANDLTLEEYTDIIEYGMNQAYLERLYPEQNPFKLACRLVHFAHDLHLARCLDAKTYQMNLEIHFQQLDIPADHEDIKTLFQLVFGCIERMGDMMRCELTSSGEIKDCTRNYRSPFELFSTQVKKCEDLIRRAPLTLPSSSEVEKFLDFIQTERNIRQLKIPNLLELIHFDEIELVRFFKIQNVSFERFFQHPFMKKICWVPTAISVLLNEFTDKTDLILTHLAKMGLLHNSAYLCVLLARNPTLAESIWKHINTAMTFTDLDLVLDFFSFSDFADVLFEKPDILQSILPILQENHLTSLCNNDVKIMKFLRQPLVQQRASQDLNFFRMILRLFTKQVTAQFPWEKIQEAIDRRSTFYLVVAAMVDKKNKLITNLDLLNAIQSPTGLIQEPSSLAKILSLTQAHMQLFTFTRFQSMVENIEKFILFTRHASPDVSLQLYHLLNIQNLIVTFEDLVSAYGNIPGIRLALAPKFNALFKTKNLKKYKLLAQYDEDMLITFFSDPHFIDLIQTTAQLDEFVFLANKHCGKLLDYPQLLPLMTSPTTVLALIRSSPQAYFLFKKQPNAFRPFSSISHWFMLIELHPQEIDYFLTFPNFISEINTGEMLVFVVKSALSEDENTKTEALRAMLVKVLKAVESGPYTQEKLIDYSSACLMLEYAPDILTTSLKNPNGKLTKKFIADHELLSSLATSPDLMTYLIENHLDLFLKTDISHLTYALSIAPHLAVNHLRKHAKIVEDLLPFIDEIKLQPMIAEFLIEHPKLIVQLPLHEAKILLPYLKEFILRECHKGKSITSFIKIKSVIHFPIKDIMSLIPLLIDHLLKNLSSILTNLNDLPLLFCAHPKLQVALLPHMYRINDASCQQQMLSMVSVKDRAMVKQHFANPIVSPTVQSVNVNAFFSANPTYTLEAKDDDLQEYRNNFQIVTYYLAQLEKSDSFKPMLNSQELAMVKQNPCFMGLLLSSKQLPEEMSEQIIEALADLLTHSDDLLRFFEAYPQAVVPSLGIHAP